MSPADSDIISAMTQYAQQESLCFANTGSYTYSGDSGYPLLGESVNEIKGINNNSNQFSNSNSSSAYILCAGMASSGYTYCIDSTGYAKETSKTCASRVTSYTCSDGTVQMNTGLFGISATFSTVAPSTNATETIVFTTSSTGGGVAGGQTITIAWPTAWTGLSSLVTGDMTMRNVTQSVNYPLTTSIPSSGQVKWALSASTITFTLASSGVTVHAGDQLKITFGSTNFIQNPAAGNYTIALTSGATDTGSTTVPIVANTVVISGTVNQYMTFALTGNSAALGSLSSSTATQNCADYFDFGTNAPAGGTITYSGTTLTAGNGTDNFGTACVAGCTSSTGTTQFGFNLMHNTAPTTCGTAVAATTGGTPIGTVAAGYSTANTYQFHTGDTIASASAPIASTRYYLAFLANVSALQAAGSYTTNLTFTAAATY